MLGKLFMQQTLCKTGTIVAVLLGGRIYGFSKLQIFVIYILLI